MVRAVFAVTDQHIVVQDAHLIAVLRLPADNTQALEVQLAHCKREPVEEFLFLLSTGSADVDFKQAMFAALNMDSVVQLV